VEAARVEQEAFMQRYFVTSQRPLPPSNPKSSPWQTRRVSRPEHSYSDPIEGSDTITMMTITANYEGSYADMVEFVNLIDRSDRFLIIDKFRDPAADTRHATARLRVNAFLRVSHSSGVPPAESRTSEHPAPPVAAKLGWANESRSRTAEN
jgi:hypothetical protein